MARGDDQIRRYFLFRAVTSFSMWLPFWTLWAFVNLHQEMFLLTLVDSAFWITMIMFQIPAGLLGDKFGRKPVLFVGEAVYAVGVLAFGFSTELWMLVGANAVWAIGVCFIVSGDTPFLYDTLLENGRQSEFIKISARQWTVQAAMNAAACVVGGVLVELADPTTPRYDLTLKISAVVGLVGCLSILLVREPKVNREHFVSYGKQLREGMRRVMSSRAILTLITFQMIVEIAVYVMAVFRSVYMKDNLRLDYWELGSFVAAFTVVGGIAAFQAGRIEGALGEKRSLLFLLLSMIVSFVIVFLVSNPSVIIIQFLVYSVSALQAPIINGYINKRVDSPHRSTVIAIATLLFTAGLVFAEVGSGWIADRFGLTTSLLILAIGATPIGLYLLVLWNREVDKSRSEASPEPGLMA